MISEGFIKKTPPHRVWPEYSEEYVYLIRAGEDRGMYPEHIRNAFDQAAYAMYKFEHEHRVVLEIHDLDEQKIGVDRDSECISGCTFNENIPIQKVVNVYFMKNEKTEDIYHLIAIDWLNRNKLFQHFEFATDIFMEQYMELINDSSSESDIKELKFRSIGYLKDHVKYLDTFPDDFFMGRIDLENYYFDLMDKSTDSTENANVQPLSSFI